MALRTAQIAAAETFDPGLVTIVLATCPVGQTWLLKDCVIVNLFQATINCSVSVQKPSNGPIGNLLGPQNISNLAAAVVSGRFLVMLPGDQLIWTKALGGLAGRASLMVSGARLAGVAA